VVRGRSPKVEYSFAVNGVRYGGNARLPNCLVRNKSDPIAIRFLPSDPSINHPDGWEWSPIEGFYGVPYYAIGLGATIWGLAYSLRERKLVRWGKPAERTVTNCISKDRWYEVEYEFRAEDGEYASGTSDCAESYEAGQNIWIVYLPKRPGRNYAYRYRTAMF